MTNKEIDIRLMKLTNAMTELVKRRYLDQEKDPLAIELEALNMSAIAVFTMLGEIAKRLPEERKD